MRPTDSDRRRKKPVGTTTRQESRCAGEESRGGKRAPESPVAGAGQGPGQRMTPLPEDVWSLESRHLGQRVHVHDCLDSTNTLALSLSHDPTQHGLVLLARE